MIPSNSFVEHLYTPVTTLASDISISGLRARSPTQAQQHRVRALRVKEAAPRVVDAVPDMRHLIKDAI